MRLLPRLLAASLAFGCVAATHAATAQTPQATVPPVPKVRPSPPQAKIDPGMKVSPPSPAHFTTPVIHPPVQKGDTVVVPK